MKKQLEMTAKSYDKGIDLGRKGIDSYDNFPSYITSHPKYPLFEQMRMNEAFSDSVRTFFIIDKKETVGSMIQYFLTVK